MKLATSVVVMSFVTAVPFALAIRDELARPPARVENDLWWDFPRPAPRAPQEVQTERWLDDLVGDRTAMQGSLFAGADLGRPLPAGARVTWNDVQSRSGIIIRHGGEDGTSLVRSLTAVVQARIDAVHVDACTTLRDRIGRTWGPGHGDVWLGDDQRAIYERTAEDCELRFEPALPVSRWLEALPLLEVGALAVDVEVPASAPHRDRWIAPGVGFARGSTSVELAIVDDVVLGVRVAAQTDGATLVDIIDGYSEYLGGDVVRESERVWVWPKNVGARLERVDDDRGFILTVGRAP